MSKYDDGSYSSQAGIELIAKVLSGSCQMKYTKAAVGSGNIPDGKTPKTMTEPAGYVMDAKISSITTPIDGECQVTVQINSDDVEEGFFATGILLYAEDPDEGEVPYTYLVLENSPEWIRPKTSAVGKIASFDLITAVGEIDNVTAKINPSALLTSAEAEQLIDTKVNAAKTELENKIKARHDNFPKIIAYDEVFNSSVNESIAKQMIPIQEDFTTIHVYADSVDLDSGETPLTAENTEIEISDKLLSYFHSVYPSDNRGIVVAGEAIVTYLDDEQTSQLDMSIPICKVLIGGIGGNKKFSLIPKNAEAPLFALDGTVYYETMKAYYIKNLDIKIQYYYANLSNLTLVPKPE